MAPAITFVGSSTRSGWTAFWRRYACVWATKKLTAVTTADAVTALKFRRGDDASAIIKSTEVMIERASARSPSPARRRRK